MRHWLIIIVLFIACAGNAQVRPCLLKGALSLKDKGMPFVHVVLTKDSARVDSAFTSLDGYFKFKDLAPGVYQLNLNRSDCHTVVIDSVVVSSGTNLFGFKYDTCSTPGSLMRYKWSELHPMPIPLSFLVTPRNPIVRVDSSMVHFPPTSTPPIKYPTKGYTLPVVNVSSFQLGEVHENYHQQSFGFAQIQGNGVESIADLLTLVSSVHVKEYGTGIATPSIRGTGAGHTQVYWNGIPINLPTLGESDLSVLDPNLSESIELTYGSGASYSSGALGGSLDLVNRLRWGSGRSNLWFRKSYGSFGNQGATMKLHLSSRNKALIVSANRSYGDNDFGYLDRTMINPVEKQLENADFTSEGVSVTGGWRKGRHEVKTTVALSGSERGLATAMGVPSKGERQADYAARGVMDYQFKTGKFQNQLKLGGMKTSLVYRNPQIDLTSSNQNQLLFFQNESNMVLKKYWQLLFQLSARLESAESSGFSNPVSRNILGNNIRLTRDGEIVNYTFSLRTEVVDGVVNPLLPGVGGEVTLWKDRKLPIDFKIRWNANRNYRMPSLNQLYWNPGGNPELEPEIGFSGDVGIEITSYRYLYKEDMGRDFMRDHRLSATVFHSDINNWIIWTPAGQYWEPRNVKRVRNQGFELSYSYGHEFQRKNLPFLVTRLDYSLTDNQVLESGFYGDVSVGNTLIFIPRHNLRYSIQLHFDKWEITFGQSITSRVYIDAANQSYMPWYAPSYAQVAKLFKKKDNGMIRLRFRVNNLFNEEYQVMPNRPMPGAHFRFMMEVGF